MANLATYILRLAAGARNERTAIRRKIQLPLQAPSEVCSRPKRNKWRGPTAGGEVAVYAGFGLEQTQRSARGVGLTMPSLAIKLSQEPITKRPGVHNSPLGSFGIDNCAD